MGRFPREDRRVSDFEGRCLCGSVRFAVTPPTLFFAHCHCRWCREAQGAAFVSWVGATEGRFRYLPGSAEPTWYQSTPQSRRGFCPNCGTVLFFASTLCPGEIHIVRPALRCAIDREPDGHSFWDQRVDWIEMADRLPRHATDDPGLAKFRAVKRPD
jgi:hypothetical protein